MEIVVEIVAFVKISDRNMRDWQAQIPGMPGLREDKCRKRREALRATCAPDPQGDHVAPAQPMNHVRRMEVAIAAEIDLTEPISPPLRV
jgi:hypothetical protein